MGTVRKIWPVLVGAWLAAWVARALFDWLLGVEGGWLAIAVIVAALAGGIAGMREARQVEPMTRHERRDTALGWTAFVGGVAAVACLLLIALPWGIVAGALVAVITAVALRRF